MFESTWVESDYNDCGYRSAHSCRTKAPDALRVAVLGTSISRGYWLPYNQSFAGRVEHDLTVACQQPVDLQNVSQANSILVTGNGRIPIWHHIADRVPEALALRPNALVLVMAPFDLESYEVMPESTGASAATAPVTPGPRGLVGLFKTIKNFINNDSRVILVARHIAYQDTDRYVLHDLQQGDSSDYLRQPFTAKWALRLKVADQTISRIASQANAAGVPLIVVLMPLRTQAALSAAGVDRHQTHPFALGRALSGIVRAQHADFIDMTNVTSTLRDPADLFFEINGHPNAAGDAALARSVETALVRDVQGFSHCRPVGPRMSGR